MGIYNNINMKLSRIQIGIELKYIMLFNIFALYNKIYNK